MTVVVSILLYIFGLNATTGKITPCNTTSLPNGSISLPNGSISLPNGSTSLPNGSSSPSYQS
jgi:hypothetical protein